MGVGNCMRIPRSDLKCGCATHLKVLCARGAISLQTESKIVHFIIITISGRHLPGAIGRARLWNAVYVCVCVRPPQSPGSTGTQTKFSIVGNKFGLARLYDQFAPKCFHRVITLHPGSDCVPHCWDQTYFENTFGRIIMDSFIALSHHSCVCRELAPLRRLPTQNGQQIVQSHHSSVHFYLLAVHCAMLSSLFL